jgi:hypothetical protein
LYYNIGLSLFPNFSFSSMAMTGSQVITRHFYG